MLRALQSINKQQAALHRLQKTSSVVIHRFRNPAGVPPLARFLHLRCKRLTRAGVRAQPGKKPPHPFHYTAGANKPIAFKQCMHLLYKSAYRIW